MTENLALGEREWEGDRVGEREIERETEKL